MGWSLAGHKAWMGIRTHNTRRGLYSVKEVNTDLCPRPVMTLNGHCPTYVNAFQRIRIPSHCQTHSGEGRGTRFLLYSHRFPYVPDSADWSVVSRFLTRGQ